MSVYRASHQGTAHEVAYTGKGFGLPGDFMPPMSPQYAYMHGQGALASKPLAAPVLTPELRHAPPRAQGRADRYRCGTKRQWLGVVVLVALAAAFVAGRYARRP